MKNQDVAEIPAIDACGAQKLVSAHYEYRRSLKGILLSIEECSRKGKTFLMVPGATQDVIDELKRRKFVIVKGTTKDEIVVSWEPQ